MRALFEAYRNKLSNKLYGRVRVSAVGTKRGEVLMSYLTEPFTKAPWEPLSNYHTNYWECREMARLFSLRGYDVDIINWIDREFIPKKPYRICVDVQDNLERLIPHLPPDCVKVMHVTTSEQSFQNNAEEKRLTALYERRGFTLMPHRELPAAKNPELANFLEGFGNETVRATYARYGKPIFPIPISVVKEFPFHEREYEEARTHFVWLGGGGAVLKGLDLVLEAFAQKPELTLHVCGPVVAEKDFADAYHRELFETPNIRFHGRIDIASSEFESIMRECAALIYPAFSEGTSGSVVQAMHAGLIPLITPQSGIREDAPAVLLQNPTVDSVLEAARALSQKSPEELSNLALSAWKFANEHYTREAFSRAYAAFIDSILPS